MLLFVFIVIVICNKASCTSTRVQQSVPLSPVVHVRPQQCIEGFFAKHEMCKKTTTFT